MVRDRSRQRIDCILGTVVEQIKYARRLIYVTEQTIAIGSPSLDRVAVRHLVFLDEGKGFSDVRRSLIDVLIVAYQHLVARYCSQLGHYQNVIGKLYKSSSSQIEGEVGVVKPDRRSDHVL